MTFLSYEDVRPWAKIIREKVRSREMPPWGADRKTAAAAAMVALRTS